ncbi:MAG TPA: hypothetical protein VGL11_15600 [Candidatus Binatia bacterium]|jgi:hypothetical protein
MSRLTGLKNRYRALSSELNLRGTFALAAAVRRFVSERVTFERAEREVKATLGGRAEIFLDLARTRIYARPSSPYLKLLKLAGCDYSDLEAQVRREGLEATLERLARQGVYLTADEFKGKKEVVRGFHSFRVSPGDLENAPSASGFVTESSGTRNRPLRSAASLDQLADWVLTQCIFFSAHNLFSYSHAVYDAILPSGGGVRNLLSNARLGITTDRWFARRFPHNTSLGAWYHYLITYLIVVVGKQFGPGFPRPEFVDVENMRRIVEWVLRKKQQGKLCCITTAASNATRIARHAWDMGASLEGTKFVASGEPLTDAKRELIERVGAVAIPNYGSEDLWVKVGYGCANPVYTDELHVNQQVLALIAHPTPFSYAGLSIRPLLFTSLHPLSPRIFLNVANGDYATLVGRDCGCALERVGFTLHIHRVRSYEKFTSEGMNYFYGDLFELFEKTLPSEFGGGPGDYQLVEEEDNNGQTRLTLLVRPDIGNVDEERLIARLKEALAQGSKGDRFMAAVWQRAGTFRVRRQIPYTSPRGKILPLHIMH